MTKNQHFVPQFYLRRFLNHNNEVEVLDLNLMQCANPRGTRKICSAEFFYGIETGIPDETSQKVEDWFQKMESFIGDNLDSIVDKILNNKQIEIADKWILAFLMSMLWIRGQEMRKQIRRITEETTKWMIAQEYSIQPDKPFDEYDNKMGVTTSPEIRKQIQEILVSKDYELKPNNTMHIENFENIKNYANLFYHQYWTVYISNVSKKFATTDNPLAIRFPKAKGFYGRTFLERAHYFPLTPDIFIFATESNDAPDKPGIRLKRKTLLKGGEGQVLELNAVMAIRLWNASVAVGKCTPPVCITTWYGRRNMVNRISNVMRQFAIGEIHNTVTGIPKILGQLKSGNRVVWGTAVRPKQC